MISREELSRAFDARFSPEIREKLSAAHVAVAGLGGLGSNISVMLARSGVGHLLLVDFDTVDVTNLNRQAYGIPHLGMTKCEAIQKTLADINPYLDIETHILRVTEENATALFKGSPIVCEAFDRADQKAMLVGTLLRETECTVVSGIGMAGYSDSNRIRTEKRLSRLYVCGDQTTDVGEDMGLMAPRVAVCAGHMANKVIQLILDDQSEKNQEEIS